MLKSLVRWILRHEQVAVDTSPAAPEGEGTVSLLLHPYATTVDRKDYLAAWDQLAQIKEGQLVIRAFHNHLVATLEERCPDAMITAEARALWLAGHDARKKTWMDLTLAAVKGSRLSQTVNMKRTPQLVAGGAQEN